MGINDVIEVSKKYYPEAVTSLEISKESGVSRGAIASTIRKMRSKPKLYDEVCIYEKRVRSGKKSVFVLYLNGD